MGVRGQGTNSLAYLTNESNVVGLGTSIFSTTCYQIIWLGTEFLAMGTGTTYSLATSSDAKIWTGVSGSLAVMTTARGGAIGVTGVGQRP